MQTWRGLLARPFSCCSHLFISWDQVPYKSIASKPTYMLSHTTWVHRASSTSLSVTFFSVTSTTPFSCTTHLSVCHYFPLQLCNFSRLHILYVTLYVLLGVLYFSLSLANLRLHKHSPRSNSILHIRSLPAAFNGPCPIAYQSLLVLQHRTKQYLTDKMPKRQQSDQIFCHIPLFSESPMPPVANYRTQHFSGRAPPV